MNESLHVLAGLSGLPLVPNKIIRVPEVGSLAAGVTSAAQMIRWPRKAIVIGMVGQVREATDVGLASAEARIVVRSDTDLFSDGNGAVFVPFLALFKDKPFFPLGIPILAAETWQVYMKNRHSATAYNPDLLFLVHEVQG